MEVFTAAVMKSSGATASTVASTLVDFMATVATSTTVVSTTEVTSGISGVLGLTIITSATRTIPADSRSSSEAAIHTTADSPPAF